VRVVGNYFCGFALFWILGIVAGLLGNIVSGGNGEVAGRAVLGLHIIFLTVVVYLAIKWKARGIVPGVIIGVVVYGVGLIWSLRGSGHA